MDIVEIDSPLCIATCSLDAKIILFSLLEGTKIRVIDGDHRKGVRRLAYSTVLGGYLVSVGYDVTVNVWAPESVVSDNFLGKLKGHTKPVVEGAFIGRSPFLATVDESNTVRIWDIKSLACL